VCVPLFMRHPVVDIFCHHFVMRQSHVEMKWSASKVRDGKLIDVIIDFLLSAVPTDSIVFVGVFSPCAR